MSQLSLAEVLCYMAGPKRKHEHQGPLGHTFSGQRSGQLAALGRTAILARACKCACSRVCPARWTAASLGSRACVFARAHPGCFGLQAALDPTNILNPGKLGSPSP